MLGVLFASMSHKNQLSCVCDVLMRCKDIGLARRLLGYTVWLLEGGLAASIDTTKANLFYNCHLSMAFRFEDMPVWVLVGVLGSNV